MSEHPHPTIRQLVAQIAEVLIEIEPQPIEQIRRLIKVMARISRTNLLHETQAIESAGGLFLERDYRRRTLGGVFFFFAHNRMTNPQRGKVFTNPVTNTQAGVPAGRSAGRPASPHTALQKGVQCRPYGASRSLSATPYSVVIPPTPPDPSLSDPAAAG
jgi:hypothetical protein